MKTRIGVLKIFTIFLRAHAIKNSIDLVIISFCQKETLFADEYAVKIRVRSHFFDLRNWIFSFDKFNRNLFFSMLLTKTTKITNEAEIILLS